MEPEQIKVSVGDFGDITVAIYLAEKRKRVGITLILGHGAGANQFSNFMRMVARGLAERGLDVVTFNFLYSEKGRGAPDPKPKLELCYQSAIDAARRHPKLKRNRVAIGGKSMGGRISSQVAARSEQDLLGLVFLGYPLHAPGKPNQPRDAHLPDVHAPMFFIQGGRDPFGTPAELEKVFSKLKPKPSLLEIETGDHSFKVLKSIKLSQDQVHELIMDEIAKWLTSHAS